MTEYANLVRIYNGQRTLYAAANHLDHITVRTDVSYGSARGYWGYSPFFEVESSFEGLTPQVMALTEPVERGLSDPAPVLFDLILKAVEAAWRPDAFHLVFHSSGWDSRMISGAIRELLHRHGKEWLGKGLLLLSNRWEKEPFLEIMALMGWIPDQYAVYDEGPAGEHFAEALYETWRFAPLCRPANFFWYLPEWAEHKGLLPIENVQAFTGLWSNEVWEWFYNKGCERWPQIASEKFGWHHIAAMPVRAQWVEYPLVSLPILDVLRHIEKQWTNGSALRRLVADYVVPKAVTIRRGPESDGGHPLSERLQAELDAHYRQTALGQRVPWIVPEHSGSQKAWGQWSMALLIDRLIAEGKRVEFVDRREWIRRQRQEHALTSYKEPA